ncbi:MAG: hypothetical protein H6744_03620 [Deltaproteobacteria bacterium]|nr:hypothetical protein [Deltaproteobacteria bacterium]MCB9785765.1 hypothetical protein [Deltaproteobacteria bacterium]
MTDTRLRATPAVGGLALFAALFAWCLRPAWGIDIFFHVAIGREILAHGVPTTDVFSAAHPDAAWAPFQLGYELLVALLDRAGGLDLLRVFHAGVFATALTWLAVRARRATGSVAAAALILALTLLLFDERLRMRPHALNLLFEVAVLLPFAAGSWRLDPGRARLVVFATAVLWSFVHAMGALWLLAVVGTVLVAGPGATDRRYAATTLALASAGVLLAPGAAAGIAHVLSIQDRWLPFVPELQPSWTWFRLWQDGGGAYALLAGLLPWLGPLAVVLALATRPPPARRPTLLAAAGLALGAVLLVRLSYYAAFVLVLLAPELRTLTRRLWRPRLWALALSLALLSVLAAHVLPRWASTNPWTTTLSPGLFPVAEARVLDRAGIRARIWNETDWGGYLLYVLHPGATVASDGRITFAPDVAELLRADEHPSRRLAVAEAAYQRYGIDLMVRRRGALPESPQWELLLRGPTADVWSRRGPLSESRKSAISRVLESTAAGS